MESRRVVGRDRIQTRGLSGALSGEGHLGDLRTELKPSPPGWNKPDHPPIRNAPEL